MTQTPRLASSNRRRLVTFLAGVALIAAVAAPSAAQRVKMATLSPTGSPWDTILKKMGTSWEQGTDERVTLDIYAGSVAGDEADILRKMKIGQYHAGALSVAGLVDIDKAFTVFEVPLFFASFEEMMHVLNGMAPTLDKKLDEGGFVRLAWGYVGWVYFFTTSPVHTVADMQELKIFSLAGDEALWEWWRRNGFQPVSLASTDILTGLQTGMVDAISVPPLYAMQTQYFKRAPYMADMGLAPMMGAVILSKRAFNRMSEADRKVVLEAGREAEKRVMEQIPPLDETAIKMMSANGLTVTEIENTEHAKDWQTKAEDFAANMRGDIVPADIFDEALRLRDQFRAQNQASGSSQ